jgi:hypothetical protein
MKKSKKKNNRRSYPSYYTPGRNMFGEKAETYLIVLKRETALQQMLDAARQFDNYYGKIEFIFDMSCFNGYPEECAEVKAKVEAFLDIMVVLKTQQGERFTLYHSA